MKKYLRFKTYDININEILVSKEEPYGSNKSIKHFIGYNDNDNLDLYA